MSGVIYLVHNETNLIKMEQTDYTCEEDFQQLLEKFPGLLAGEQIDRVVPRKWLFVARELPVPSELEGSDRWYLDHLFLDQDAIPTLVEVKRRTDTRLRREVIGQMLDYAANAVVYWPGNEIERQFVKTCEKSGQDPQKTLAVALGDTIEYDTFWKQAEDNLRRGNVRLLFVADRISPELQRVAEFLNERMSPTEVLAIEISRYVGGGFSTHIPRVVGQTSKPDGPRSGRRTWDEVCFFEDAKRRLQEEEVSLITRLYNFAKEYKAQIDWGTGAVRGSFNPKFLRASKRSPITVWSDGTMDIKLSWLDDSPAAEHFRRIYKAELGNVEIPVAEWGGTFTIQEWGLWVDKLISATLVTLQKYSTES